MSVTDGMRTILQGDATLATILPGGIHDRPLSPTDPITADAWIPNPTTGVKRLQPAAVLLEPQEVDSPVGRNPLRRIDVDLWPELVIYAEWDDIGAFDAADARSMELLHNRAIGLADITATGYRARPLEAPELPGNVWTTLRRYRVQMVRHIAGV